MSRSVSQSELQTLLRRARVIRSVPSAARARVLARAISTVGAPATALPLLEISRFPQHWLSLAGTGTLALVIGVSAAVVALRGITPPTPPVPATVIPPDLRVVPIAVAELPAPDTTAPEPVLAPPAPTARAFVEVRRRPAKASPRESYAAELELMHHAQTAYVRRDFSGALVFLAEHARRFASGLLAEEREALRVRSLSGLGHTREAERAAAGFAARFPRSVLLPRAAP